MPKKQDGGTVGWSIEATDQPEKPVDKKHFQKVLEGRIRGLVVTKVDNIREKDLKIVAGKEWKYDLDLRTLTYQSEGNRGIDNMTEKEVVACILHEVGHAKHSSLMSYPLMTRIQSSLAKPEHLSEFTSLVNAYEDLRIERLLMADHPGTYDNFRYIQEISHERNLTPEELEKMPKSVRVLVNLFRQEWGYDILPIDEKSDEACKVLASLVEELASEKTTPDMAEKILSKVWPVYSQLIDDNGGKSQSPKDGEQESQQQKKQSAPDMQEILESLRQQGQPKEQEKQEDDEQKQENQPQSFSEQIKQEIREQKHEKTIEKLLEFAEDKEQIPNKGNWNEVKESMKMVRKYDPVPTYEELLQHVSQYLPYFRRKIRSIMEDNQAKRFGGAYRSGKLNGSILYKFQCNSTRLFGKRIVRSHKNYAVCLLVDESGSMYGDCTEQATYATVMLAETLHGANIPFEIVGFNDQMKQYKTLNEPLSWKVRRRLETMWINSRGSESGSTNDAYYLNKVSRGINKIDAERVIIVLSDGSPSPSGRRIDPEDRPFVASHFVCTDDFKLDEEVMKAGQKASVIGVGIQTDSVKRYYRNSVVCNDVSQLPSLVLNILRGLIKRG